MTIEGGLLARGIAVSALTDLIGTGNDARLYAMRLKQNETLPAVTYSRVGGTRNHNMGTDTGNVESRWQFSCWATTYEGVRDVSTAVRTAYSRFSGTSDSTVIDDIFVENEVDLFESTAGDALTDGLYHRVLDLIVFYRE